MSEGFIELEELLRGAGRVQAQVQVEVHWWGSLRLTYGGTEVP